MVAASWRVGVSALRVASSGSGLPAMLAERDRDGKAARTLPVFSVRR
jgi:hypothetical protein